MGWPVGRVLYAEAWRPSIYERRCRRPPAVYPRTRAGRPQSCARPVRAPDFLTLLQVGFAEPAGSPRSLVVSYSTVSPLPLRAEAVCSLWHCPAGCPGWVLPTTSPCGARTFLGTSSVKRG